MFAFGRRRTSRVSFALLACLLPTFSSCVPLPEPPVNMPDFPEFNADEFETTSSGLKYRVVREGEGAKPKPTDSVEVHYHGALPNGREFDSSYRRGETIEFPLNGVIGGWTEGLQLVGEGGAIQLIIPPELGYGARGAGSDIPPNATLHFNVELFKVL